MLRTVIVNLPPKLGEKEPLAGRQDPWGASEGSEKAPVEEGTKGTGCLAFLPSPCATIRGPR